MVDVQRRVQRDARDRVADHHARDAQERRPLIAQADPPHGASLDDSHDENGDALAVSALIPRSTVARGPRGRFAKGNTDATKHGLYATRITAALRAERQSFEQQSISDDGGDDLPARRRSLHRYRARLHVQIEALSTSLESFGLFDKRGKLRVVWLQRVESLITTALRIDQQLGLDRRPRDLDLVLDDDDDDEAPMDARQTNYDDTRENRPESEKSGGPTDAHE